MQVKLIYSPRQLEKAISFLSTNHYADYGPKYIRESIWSNIVDMVKQFPHLQRVSTMGYTLIADSTEESLDEDENEIFIEISVDPAIDEEYTGAEQIFDIEREIDEQ